jgi:hypothetical protein
MGVAGRNQWVKVLALALPLALAGCGDEGGEDLTDCKIKNDAFGADTEEQGRKLSKKVISEGKAKLTRRSKFEIEFREPIFSCKKQKVAAEEEVVDDSPYKLKEQKKKKKAETKQPLLWCTVKIVACPVKKEQAAAAVE